LLRKYLLRRLTSGEYLFAVWLKASIRAGSMLLAFSQTAKR
jgi:hypothetical protein